MKKILLMMIVAAAGMVACKSKSNQPDNTSLTASEFYEKVAELEETLSEPLLKAEAEIKVRGDKSDFEGIARSAKAMEDTVDTRIKILNGMPPAGFGGEDFKLMVVRYFDYIKSIYTTYRKIGEAKTEEERVKAAGEMKNIMDVQSSVMNNLQTSQARFAADNHFTIDAQ